MTIVDCDTHFGVQPASSYSADCSRLIQAEKAEGVAYVMAYSLTGRGYDAREGNDEALDVSRRHPEVLPVATVDPRAFYRVEEEIARVCELGCVALRVFPEFQGWPIDSALFASIAQVCDRVKLTLMVSVESPGKATQLLRAAGESEAAIVMLNANYGVQAEALCALEQRPNTYLCTRFFVTPWAYEEAIKRVGAHRLVFGTDAPANGIRQVISMLMRSSISDADKSAVLSGNILGLIRPQLAKLGKNVVDYDSQRLYSRKCTTTPIVDVHGHLGPWPFPMRNCTVAKIQEITHRVGIERCVVSSTKAIVSDFLQGNEELDAAIRDAHGIYGYVTVNPNHPDQSIKEIEKYADSPKFVGLKMHPSYSKSQIDCENSIRIARFAEQKNLPFLIHTMGAGEPDKIRRLAEQVPKLPIIMGHGGAVAWREAVEVVKDTQNTFVEFCCSTEEYGKIRQVIDAIGLDRILFGSDFGLFDPAYNLGTYEEADLTPQEESAIMRDNALRLFAFPQPSHGKTHP